MTSTVMLDVDGYLRTHDLPTWDINDAKAFSEKLDLKATASPFIELYLAAPGYKALAQSTTNESFFADTYNADTPEHAKQAAVAACETRHSGHTCKIIDPPEGKRVEENQGAEAAKIELVRETNGPAPTGRLSPRQPTTTEGTVVRRKFPPKVKLLRQRATPPPGGCEGTGAVKTESGNCLRWVVR